ncbi:MAG: rhomboid family intramembrane serine protease [Sphingobacteriales bacterium]|nr:MAG: rhomboid family intramembrane serine protease [Sphingobacteriales bacterium]
MDSIIQDIKNQFEHGSMVTRLVLVNIFVYIADNILHLLFFLISLPYVYDSVMKWFMVTASLREIIFKPWSLVTYIFLHDGIWHLAFNMLTFWIFGQILYNYLGNRKILPIFIYGGIVGALICILMFNVLPALQPFLHVPMLGASAGVMAIVLAAATLQPNHQISLILLGPVRIKYIALAFILLDLTTIAKDNPGGHIAHLGGAIFGYYFINQLQRGNDLSIPFNNFVEKVLLFIKGLFNKHSLRVNKNPKYVYPNSAKQQNAAPPNSSKSASDQERLDYILEKIASVGYENLSREEKEFLFKMSKD